MAERWYLGCDHEGPEGFHSYGAWFLDHRQLLEALTQEMGLGYYTRFTICQGLAPARSTGKRGLAAGAWYRTPGQERA